MRKEDDVKQDIVDAQEKEESEQLEVKEKVVCKWWHLLVQKLKEKNEICEAKLKECQEENLQLKKLLAEKCKLEDKTEEEHIQEIQILNQKLNFQQSFYYNKSTNQTKKPQKTKNIIKDALTNRNKISNKKYQNSKKKYLIKQQRIANNQINQKILQRIIINQLKIYKRGLKQVKIETETILFQTNLENKEKGQKSSFQKTKNKSLNNYNNNKYEKYIYQHL